MIGFARRQSRRAPDRPPPGSAVRLFLLLHGQMESGSTLTRYSFRAPLCRNAWRSSRSTSNARPFAMAHPDTHCHGTHGEAWRWTAFERVGRRFAPHGARSQTYLRDGDGSVLIGGTLDAVPTVEWGSHKGRELS